MPESKPHKDLTDLENIYVVEQTSDMDLEELIDKIKVKVQQVLSDDSKQVNN